MARKKYETHVLPRLKEIEAWCRNGKTDKEISRRLGIGYSTFNEYKIKYSKLLETLKTTKDFADDQVEGSLFKCANGYFVTEKVVVGKGENARVEEVERYIPPNTLAQIFWLKNRRPSQWKDRRESDDSSDIIAVPIQITYSIRKEEPVPADNAEHPTV
jgi:hypothetical protein